MKFLKYLQIMIMTIYLLMLLKLLKKTENFIKVNITLCILNLQIFTKINRFYTNLLLIYLYF